MGERWGLSGFYDNFVEDVPKVGFDVCVADLGEKLLVFFYLLQVLCGGSVGTVGSFTQYVSCGFVVDDDGLLPVDHNSVGTASGG